MRNGSLSVQFVFPSPPLPHQAWTAQGWTILGRESFAVMLVTVWIISLLVPAF